MGLWAAVILGAASPQSARADTQTCRNSDLEIVCLDGRCEVNEGFTPLSVKLEGARLSVCAYSGCWEGEAERVEDDRSLYMVSHAMKWSGADPGEDVSFQLALSKVTGIAVLNGASFALPLQCVE